MANKSSSKRWLKEHFTDTYVKRAQQEGYRSRAVFKLQELQERGRLFKPGMTIVDLGAAPGGWSQLLTRYVNPHGKVIALDLLPMEPIEGVDVLQGDFSDDAMVALLQAKLENKKVDWVLSDMAPNMSGNPSIDMPRAMYLSELALDFALKVIHSEGGFLIKVFQGEGFDAFLKDIKHHFKKVVIRKPKASRGRSREVYIVAQDLRSDE